MLELKVNSYSFNWIKYLSLLGSVALFVCFIFNNEVPQDEGDGLQHFAFAQESWNNSTFFLNHWGKPLFTFFSSPFAQGGFLCFTLFNMFVFIGTIIFIFKIFQYFEIGIGYSIITPFLLLSIPDYCSGIVAGLTEPFFGFLVVLCAFLLLKNRWILFALVVSFMPFARSEGMLVVVLAAVVLIHFRKWKMLPLLAVGFLFYAIVGKILIDQPWWYFENDPYQAKSIYGSGSWLIYISSRNLHLGILPILLLPIGVFGWLIWKSKQRTKMLSFTFFVVGIYLGIVVMHSYLWAFGLKGSLGLSRIATQGLPAFICLLLVACHFVSKELNSLVNTFLFVLMSLMLVKEINELEFPNKATGFQKMVFKASNYLKKQDLKGRKIYYLHPLLPYNWGLNTLQKHTYLHQRFIHLYQDQKTIFKPGDLFFRDSHFGPLEQGLSLDSLKKYPWFVPVKQFYPVVPTKEFNGDQQCVVIYQFTDPKEFIHNEMDERFASKPFSFPQKQCKKKINSAKIFENFSDRFIIPDGTQGSIQLKLTFSFDQAIAAPIFLIFDDGKGTYCSAPLTDKNQTVEWPFSNRSTSGILFIHNPNGIKYSLRLNNVSWEKRNDTGLLPF